MNWSWCGLQAPLNSYGEIEDIAYNVLLKLILRSSTSTNSAEGAAKEDADGARISRDDKDCRTRCNEWIWQGEPNRGNASIEESG
jgi:hypothetical protein